MSLHVISLGYQILIHMNIDKMRELEHILYIHSNLCGKVESPILFKSPPASLDCVCRAQSKELLKQKCTVQWAAYC